MDGAPLGAASGGASATNLMGFDAAADASEADEANPPSSSCASSPCFALDLPVGTLSFRLSFSPLGIVKSRAGVLSMKARAFCSSRS